MLCAVDRVRIRCGSVFSTGRELGTAVRTDEAIRQLRADPKHSSLIESAYLDADVSVAAERYSRSPEFAELLSWFGNGVSGKRILDVGAGRGIATHAFLSHGASSVVALEPDPSPIVGREAITELTDGRNVEVVDCLAESIPLEDESVDIVFGRQVMHHMTDHAQAVKEMVRILKPGGRLVMIREHVVDGDRQLRSFLRGHPVHQLAGGENAFALSIYCNAFEQAGCLGLSVIGPWDSVVNAAPIAQTREELASPGASFLEYRFGVWGRRIALVPFVKPTVSALAKLPRAGRLYSFRWSKPDVRPYSSVT